MIPARKAMGRIGVYAERDASVPVAHVYVHLLAGCEADPPESAGITRLAARLMSAGTRARSREDLSRAIESIGARLDVSVAHHRVTFSGHVLAGSLGKFLDLLEEVLIEPGNRPDDLEKIRRETMASLVASRDDDQSLAYRHFRAALFPGHAYGRGAAGTPTSLAAPGHGDVVGHQEAVLGKAGIALALAGDLDPDAVGSRLERTLSSFSSGTRGDPGTRDPAPPSGLRVRLVDKPARTQSQVYAGHLGVGAADPLYFPAVVACTALGGTFTARLSREIRQARGLSYGAYARMLRSRHRDAFYMWTMPATAETAACVALEIEMLAALKGHGLDAGEMDLSREYLANHFLFAVETSAQRVNLAVREEVLGLPPGFFERYPGSVAGVGAEDVAAACGRCFDPGNMVVTATCSAERVEPGIREALGPGASIEVVQWDSEV